MSYHTPQNGGLSVTDLHRQLQELRDTLDASQRANRRQIADLERQNHTLWEENNKLKCGRSPFPNPASPGVPYVQVGHTPIQPQQPLSVSVGVKPPNLSLPHSPQQMDVLPNPQRSTGSSQQSPAPEPPEPSSREKQLAQELAEKNALLEKYRSKTRGMSLGIESQASPVASAPAGGPGAKMTAAKPRASLGGASRSLPLPGEMRESSSERDRRGAEPVGVVAVGVQNCVDTRDAFSQTQDSDAAALTNFADPSGGVAEGVLQGTKLCDAMGRLPTSRAINVHLFASVSSHQQLSGSFAGLPAALGSSLHEPPSPSASASTLPLATAGSWAEEPAPSASATMPVGRNPGSPKRGRGRGDDDRRRGGTRR
uniref:Uncharacterized protein n=1 Tax=Neobodo designis TaxID=312471 RepID=A0A7S1M9K7_NEODS